MAPYGVRYPIFKESDTQPITMVLNDEYYFSNIKKETTTEITILAANKSRRPIPVNRKDMPTKVTYTAQAICDLDEFEAFYNANLGKSIKMNFEGKTYYGYLSDLVIGDDEVTFGYTYTSKIPDVVGDEMFPI